MKCAVGDLDGTLEIEVLLHRGLFAQWLGVSLRGNDPVVDQERIVARSAAIIVPLGNFDGASFFGGGEDKIAGVVLPPKAREEWRENVAVFVGEARGFIGAGSERNDQGSVGADDAVANQGLTMGDHVV